MARSIGAVVAAALWVEGKVTYCNKGPALTRTYPTIHISTISTAHCVENRQD
jgi:hypothetical protein